MTEKKANRLKKNLERIPYGSLDVRKVKGLLPKKDWNLIVYEMDIIKKEKQLVLIHIEFMLSFKIKHCCGLLIEAEGNIPYYTLY